MDLTADVLVMALISRNPPELRPNRELILLVFFMFLVLYGPISSSLVQGS